MLQEEIMRYKVYRDVLWKKVDDEIVLVREESDGYAFLNETGVAVWECLVNSKSFDEIVAELSARYDIPAGTLRQDVEELIQDLVQSGFVEPAHS